MLSVPIARHAEALVERLASRPHSRAASAAFGLILTIVIPMSAMQSVQAVEPRRIVEIADLANVSMSPDGHRVAFRLEQASIERNAIDTTWYVQDVAGTSPPRRIADGGFAMQEFWGLPAPAPAVWSPDGHWLYYAAMLDGVVAIWRAATDGSRAERMTHDAADVREFALSADGVTLQYSVGATREEEAASEQLEYMQGIRVDKSVPVGQPLFRSGYVLGRHATQRYRGGMELYRDSLLADVPARWQAVEIATGVRRNLASSEVPESLQRLTALPAGGFQPVDRVPDPGSDRIALLTGSGDDEGLYRQPYMTLAAQVGRRSLVECRLPQCTEQVITSVQWRPDAPELLFTVTDPDEGRAQSIFRWNYRTGVIHDVVRSRGLVNGGREERSPCGVSAHVLVCVVAEADQPPRVERIELDTGKRLVLFEPNAGLALDMEATSPARFLRWQDSRGRTITGQFFAARNRGGYPPPLFVNYYSCSGFVRGGFGDEWPLAALASRGISTLCINYVPLRIDAYERYNDGLATVRSAIDLLASAGEVDRERVGMGGLSLGAEMTLWTVMNSDLLAAASVSSIGHSPLGHALRRLYDDSFSPVLNRYWQLGAPEHTPARWRGLSVAHNLDKIQAPVLMQLPEHEYMRTIDYAVPLIMDQRADLYVFPEEAHNKFQPKHKLAAYERNLDWFRFWLLQEEDPGPAKQAQYAHWRAMRAGMSNASNLSEAKD